MAVVNCYALCGVSNAQCKNKYCEANRAYKAPIAKEKPKGGPGRPCQKLKAKIKVENTGKGFFNFKDED